MEVKDTLEGSICKGHSDNGHALRIHKNCSILKEVENKQLKIDTSLRG